MARGQATNSFNPRPRVGSDISKSQVFIYNKRFNPRPRVGSDSAKNEALAVLEVFQSTPPCRERPNRRAYCGRRVVCFNPRPRVGSDLGHPQYLYRYLRFNPRPRVGSDCCNITCCVTIGSSYICAKGVIHNSQSLSLLKRGSPICLIFNKLDKVRTSPYLSDRLWFALGLPYTISVPFKSAAGLAPTCSTRRFQFVPRK